MKASDLIEALQGLDPDDEVRVAIPTRNYWSEVDACEISGVARGIMGGDEVLYDDANAALYNSGSARTIHVVTAEV